MIIPLEVRYLIKYYCYLRMLMLGKIWVVNGPQLWFFHTVYKFHRSWQLYCEHI